MHSWPWPSSGDILAMSVTMAQELHLNVVAQL